MKTSSNTPTSHITTCRVQFNGALVQHREKLKVGLFVSLSTH